LRDSGAAIFPAAAATLSDKKGDGAFLLRLPV